MKLFKILIVVSFLALLLPAQLVLANEKTLDHYIPMDMEEDYWAYWEIDELINADIVNGYLEDMGGYVDMYVNPEQNITRAEFVKLVVSALNLQETGSPKAFPDVQPENWYYDYVNTASSLEIINGLNDGSFGANDPITRDQITAIIVRAFGDTINFPEPTSTPFTDVDAGYWAYADINKAAALEIVKGVTATTFNPQNKATRAQAFVMLHRALNNEEVGLAAEADVVAFMQNHISEENELLALNDFAGLTSLYETNTTGYLYVLGLSALEDYQSFIADGATLSITPNTQNLDIALVSLNTRMASVQVTGLSYTLSLSDATSNYETEIPLEGVFQLKQDVATGAWKIYGFNEFPAY